MFLVIFHDDVISTLSHFVLLRHIWGGRLFFNVMILTKPLDGLEMRSPPFFDWNTLILYSDCVSTNALNYLYFSKNFSLDFNAPSQTFLKKLSMKVTKYLIQPMDVVIMDHTRQSTWFLNVWSITFSPCSETYSYVICLWCTLRKATRLWAKKFAKVKCH